MLNICLKSKKIEHHGTHQCVPSNWTPSKNRHIKKKVFVILNVKYMLKKEKIELHGTHLWDHCKWMPW